MKMSISLIEHGYTVHSEMVSLTASERLIYWLHITIWSFSRHQTESIDFFFWCSLCAISFVCFLFHRNSVAGRTMDFRLVELSTQSKFNYSWISSFPRSNSARSATTGWNGWRYQQFCNERWMGSFRWVEERTREKLSSSSNLKFTLDYTKKLTICKASKELASRLWNVKFASRIYVWFKLRSFPHNAAHSQALDVTLMDCITTHITEKKTRRTSVENLCK